MRMRVLETMLAVVVATALLLAGPSPVAAQGGTISGEVKVSGAAPAPKVVKVNKDNEVCGAEKKIVEVAVGPGNGLADAVVAVAGAKGAKPAKKAVLDQKGCEFRPHILVMAPGEVDILNSDGVLHNIHTFSTANPAINKAQPKFKKTMTEKFEKPEAIKVQCDAHSWMLGWIYVTGHPGGHHGRQGQLQDRERARRQAQGRGLASRPRQADQGSRGQGRPGRQSQLRARGEEVGGVRL